MWQRVTNFLDNYAAPAATPSVRPLASLSNVQWVEGSASHSWDKAAASLANILSAAAVHPGQLVGVYARPAEPGAGMVLTGLFSKQLPPKERARIRLGVAVEQSARLSWAELWGRAAQRVSSLPESVSLVGVTASSASAGMEGPSAVLTVTAADGSAHPALNASPRLATGSGASLAAATAEVLETLRAAGVRKGQLLSVQAREQAGPAGAGAQLVVEVLYSTELPDLGSLSLSAHESSEPAGHGLSTAHVWAHLDMNVADLLAQLPLSAPTDIVSICALEMEGGARPALVLWYYPPTDATSAPVGAGGR